MSAWELAEVAAVITVVVLIAGVIVAARLIQGARGKTRNALRWFLECVGNVTIPKSKPEPK